MFAARNRGMMAAVWVVGLVSLATLLTACGGHIGGSGQGHASPELAIMLEPGDREPMPADGEVVTRPWSWSDGGASQAVMNPTVIVYLHTPSGQQHGGSVAASRFTAADGAAEEAESAPAAAGARPFRLVTPAATLTFTPQPGVLPGEVGVRGEVAIQPEADYVRELGTAFGSRPSTYALLRLALRGTKAEAITGYAGTLDGLDLDAALRLSDHRVPPAYLAALRQAGYRFSVEDGIRLHNHRIDAQTAATFRAHGFDYDVSQLIRLSNYRISPDQAKAYRDSGFPRSIDDFIRMSNYRLDPEAAKQLGELKIAASIDDLIRINNYRLSTEFIKNWQEAGYTLTVDELIRAKNYRLDPAVAKKLKDGGYEPDQDDLIRLKQYRAEDLALQLADPAYEPLPIEQIIRLKQRNVDAETVASLRTARRPAEAETPAP